MKRRRIPPFDEAEAAAWFAGRIPDDWFEAPVTITHDQDEILISGPLPMPANVPEGEQSASVAARARIEAFREDTRTARMAIAEDAQYKWRRIVSWGASCGDLDAHFTTAAVPAMTRLRMSQRQVLDTLIESGVARSRAEALAWCVDQVGKHQAEWIDRLRSAMADVEKIREEGPG
ncbi:MAG: hypothetical protein KJO36_09810 [Acidimicrobiia bacterium]|nr:hypothetical protein [Acidimicrobiia bacterium]MBT8251056.1 hypothetical protein [Acidimicrobiia bacterium]NND13242.1 hypothetical protein [Acidimicrobiia bacterium]NNL29222.1 hypothetical protein [Acidimicrobiia bacterium]